MIIQSHILLHFMAIKLQWYSVHVLACCTKQSNIFSRITFILANTSPSRIVSSKTNYNQKQLHMQEEKNGSTNINKYIVNVVQLAWMLVSHTIHFNFYQQNAVYVYISLIDTEKQININGFVWLRVTITKRHSYKKRNNTVQLFMYSTTNIIIEK